jgi:hypothetical protein
MNAKEENELLKSIENNEWKRVQNFSAMKKNLEICAANSSKNLVSNKTRKMVFA